MVLTPRSLFPKFSHLKAKVIWPHQFLHSCIHHLYKDLPSISIIGYNFGVPFDFWFCAAAADGERNAILEMEGDHWG